MPSPETPPLIPRTAYAPRRERVGFWTNTPEAKPEPPEERDYLADAIQEIEDFLRRDAP